MALAYQPFWCEENIWQLAAAPEPGPGERVVLVITGAGEEVACWQQRASAVGRPVCWDYHVVLAVRQQEWVVWDLDTRLGHPLPAAQWLHGTFPCPAQVPAPFQPRFGWFPAEQWRRDFTSDREHMRNADGGWQQEPPPWPAITGQGGGERLLLTDAIAQARSGLDLGQIATRWGIVL